MSETIFIIKTAPGEYPYEELDLTGLIEVVEVSPVDHDAKMRTDRGHLYRVKRGLQKRFRISIDKLTDAEVQLFRKWVQNRTRLTVNGNYNASTILLQRFARAEPYDQDVGSIIGPTPVFVRTTDSSGIATFIDDDGLMLYASTDVPRYEDGPFGFKGILLESEKDNRAYHNYADPPTGSHLWGAGLGTPSISWRRDDTPLIKNPGFTQTTYSEQDPGDTIRFDLSGAEAGTANPQSFFMWVKGQGKIQFYVSELQPGASILAWSSVITLGGEWEIIRIEGFSRTNTTYGLRIDIAVSSPGAKFYCGPVQIEDGTTVSSFIYSFATTSSHSVRSADSLYYDIMLPDFAGTIVTAFTMPRENNEASSRWVYHRDLGSGNEFGLQYIASTNTIKFQKHTDPGSAVSYITTKTPGDTVIIAVTYSHTNGLRIYEDGVVKDTTSPFNLVETLTNGLYIGDPETDETCIDSVVSFIRVDTSDMDATEVAALCSLWTEAINLRWTKVFEGRDFEIVTPENALVAAIHKNRFMLNEVRSSYTSTNEDS